LKASFSLFSFYPFLVAFHTPWMEYLWFDYSPNVEFPRTNKSRDCQEGSGTLFNDFQAICCFEKSAVEQMCSLYHESDLVRKRSLDLCRLMFVRMGFSLKQMMSHQTRPKVWNSKRDTDAVVMPFRKSLELPDMLVILNSHLLTYFSWLFALTSCN
jgi:hypothetical protein